jgi:hypothetical protein
MRHLRRTPDAPDENCLADGAKYYFEIDRGSQSLSGKISDDQGVLRWRYRFRRCALARGWANPFNKPDFVFEDTDGNEELIIRRASFVPPVFHLMERDRVGGRLRLISPLRNRYAIEIYGLNSWTFRMPLFTIYFHGDCEIGTDVWVWMGPSEKEWSILIRPGIEDRYLLPALAFIHNERWHYA